MLRSVALKRGSFEALSFFQRLYGWRIAWRVMQDHPWSGVGYLGYRLVSHRYNEACAVLITVEKCFSEILVSMRVVGLGMLVVVIAKLFQLGREVGRPAPSSTLGHRMPIVSTRVGGVPDAAGLGERLLRLAADLVLARRMGEREAAMVDGLSAQRMVERLGGLYERLASRAGIVR